MVKGTNRRVVVVHSPDERIFEQAIFVLRDDYLQTERDGAKRLLDEAQRVASVYTARMKAGSRRRRAVWPLWAAAGAALLLIGCLAVRFGGVLF